MSERELIISPDRVQEIAVQMKSLLEELVEIQELSRESVKALTDEFNCIQHEIEVVKMSGPDRLKVMGHMIHLRQTRREHKNTMVMSDAFNQSFDTKRVLNSLINSFRSVQRVKTIQRDLVKNLGYIESIVAKPIASPIAELEVAAAELEVAATVEIVAEVQGGERIG